MASEALKTLAERYSQLYLNPYAEGAEEVCRVAVRQGIFPEKNDLPHFQGDVRDCLETVETPAGPVEILTLYKREDFETFLRIMAKHCSDSPIPKTQGASTLDGIINWRKIEAHKAAFLQEQKQKGVQDPDWSAEFRRFTSDRKNFRDTLIILSTSPYSNIPAERVGLSEEEWIARSNTIRTYHECTHVICRRLYRDQISAIWDELAADAIGIYAAFGRYDRNMEEIFLGVRDEKYCGGRLENYLSGASEKDLDQLALKVSGVLKAFEKIFAENKDKEPFELIPVLEKEQFRLWDLTE